MAIKQASPRKDWQTPEVIRHGTVEEITLGCGMGNSDAVFMQGPTTVDVSSGNQGNQCGSW
jgi:hypothetical protein